MVTAGFGVVGVSQRIDALEAAVKSVAELHQPCGEYVRRCRTCGYDGGQWPCNTRRVIEGLL